MILLLYTTGYGHQCTTDDQGYIIGQTMMVVDNI